MTEGLRDAKVFNISADTLFALASSKLEETGKAALKPLLDYVLAHPDVEIVSNGYTDSLPVPMGNDQLSQNRAGEVRQYLIDNGVLADRIQAVGHGDHDPVAPDGPGGQPLNRRVVVVVNPIGPANRPVPERWVHSMGAYALADDWSLLPAGAGPPRWEATTALSMSPRPADRVRTRRAAPCTPAVGELPPQSGRPVRRDRMTSFIYNSGGTREEPPS